MKIIFSFCLLLLGFSQVAAQDSTFTQNELHGKWFHAMNIEGTDTTHFTPELTMCRYRLFLASGISNVVVKDQNTQQSLPNESWYFNEERQTIYLNSQPEFSTFGSYSTLVIQKIDKNHFTCSYMDHEIPITDHFVRQE